MKPDKEKSEKFVSDTNKQASNIGEGFADLLSGMISFSTYSSLACGNNLLNKKSFGKIFGITALVGGIARSLVTLADDGLKWGCGVETKNNTVFEHPSRLIKSFVMGAFSGMLAPITGAVGGKVGSKVAFKTGLKVREHGNYVTEALAHTGGLKSMLTHPGGYKYYDGAKLAIGSAYVAEMATDGMLGGAVDCGFRMALEGGNLEDIAIASADGAACGAIFAPVIGGAFKGLASSFKHDHIGMIEDNFASKLLQTQEFSQISEAFKDAGRTDKELKTIIKGFFKAETRGGCNYQQNMPSEAKIQYIVDLAKDKSLSAEDIGKIAFYCKPENKELCAFYEKLRKADKDYTMKDVLDIFSIVSDKLGESDTANTKYIELVDKLCFDKQIKLSHEQRLDILNVQSLWSQNEAMVKKARYYIDNFDKLEIDIAHLPLLLQDNQVSHKQIRQLYKIMGKEKASQLTSSEVVTLAPFAKLHGVTNINEISIEDKKSMLRTLVDSNSDLFSLSELATQEFPILPTNQKEYCSLLPSIVRSMGIETRKLTPKQKIINFHNSTRNLENALKNISDEEFSQLTIRQEYSREEFIQTVLDKVKNLSRKERQKVFDYYGFELHHNRKNSTGYTITGYPINLNNGAKLAQIDDEATKSVVESLRADVIRFSENNRIICSNKDVEELLNSVIEVLPEMRTSIGKVQHGAHDYDVIKHSLKVLQKVAQNPEFDKLSDSDKKVVTLASLLHDITKIEGISDKFHANKGSFDVFYIVKKFDLTNDEQIKLYKLIKHHEWLAYVNSSTSEWQLTKRLQSVAYDLQQDNLVDLSLMFTHADLRAVKTDNAFHDNAFGKGRVSFKGKERVFDNTSEGQVKSFGESADIYAEKIREYVKELQKSQPLLPVTKMPKASVVRKAITQVNPDGSTNIKGVYISKEADGKELVVIKFNEVDDWEKIGLPKGSTTKGYKVHEYTDGKRRKLIDAETGNIKFFVHGLDYENQLAPFDAFSLVDSEALLSVSYAERPETKYRFFRSQGVLLDVQTKYIHGGGETDSGSGCKKDINLFKNEYIFGGHREQDRLYVSDLIKKATGMNDTEYVKFVQENSNKSIQEIRPLEIRDKIIKALATINSNTRRGNREYNEMYISNPDGIMGVFAYEKKNTRITNPISWLNNNNGKTEFLRRYAAEHDVPMYIFGD